VIGVRQHTARSYHPRLLPHRLFNLMVEVLAHLRHGINTDVLSGLRVCPKSMGPVESNHFEVEVELLEVASEQRRRVISVEVGYSPRHEGKKIRLHHAVPILFWSLGLKRGVSRRRMGREFRYG